MAGDLDEPLATMPTDGALYAVREATKADLSALCALGEEINAIHHRAFPSVFAGPGAADRDVVHWASGIAKDAATTFVAEEGGVVVGFVNVSLVDETHSLLQPMRFGRVGSLGVTDAHRGRGIGKALMARAENWVRDRGGQEVRLNVWAFNSSAVGMYAEIGYEVRSLHMARSLPGEA